MFYMYVFHEYTSKLTFLTVIHMDLIRSSHVTSHVTVMYVKRIAGIEVIVQMEYLKIDMCSRNI